MARCHPPVAPGGSRESPGPAPQAPGVRLAAVLRAGLRRARELGLRMPPGHRRVIAALLRCRTAALGGHRYRCAECGAEHFAPHSCRDRHCPLCQGGAARQWLAKQRAALLPCGYFHVVFTLPHALNGLVRQNQALLYRLLFDAAGRTLLQFGRNNLGARPGITAVLHTWGQNLNDHYHLHCIVTAGGLSADGRGWLPSHPRYLFPVRALSAVFGAKFCAGLRALHDRGKLEFHGALAPLAQNQEFARWLAPVAQSPWTIYSKRPFAGPGQVLAYLSRYTHRVAISERRLLALDEPAGTVRFRWRDYADAGRTKTMTLPVEEFLRRWRLHILPHRFVKIRHYGLLANRDRDIRLQQARAALGIDAHTAPNPEPSDPPADPPAYRPICPHCGRPALVLLERVPPARAPPSVLPQLV